MTQLPTRIYRPAEKQKITRPEPRRHLILQDHYEKKPMLQSGWVRTLIIVIACVLGIQAFFQTPLFRITNIELQGLKYVQPDPIRTIVIDELQKPRFIFFRNNNLFLFSDNNLKKRLASEAYVEVSSIHRRFPRSLVVTLHERIAAFVLQTPKNYQRLDTDGTAIGESEEPLPAQTIIADERGTRGAPVTRTYLETITTIKEQWEQQIQKLSISKFHLTDANDIIIVSTDKNYRVYFSPTKDLKQQINRLNAFLSDSSVEQPSEYLDLRYDEHLYAK